MGMLRFVDMKRVAMRIAKRAPRFKERDMENNMPPQGFAFDDEPDNDMDEEFSSSNFHHQISGKSVVILESFTFSANFSMGRCTEHGAIVSTSELSDREKVSPLNQPTKKARNRITRVPGSWIVRIGELFLRRKTLAKLSEEVADFREEYYEALANNRKWRCRFLVVQYHWQFFARPLRALVRVIFGLLTGRQGQDETKTKNVE
jgi:hypothetical protein